MRKSTDDSATTDGVAESSLPLSRDLAISTGIALAVLASEGWLGEERVNEHNVVALHDDAC